MENSTGNPASLHFFKSGVICDPSTLTINGNADLELLIDQNDGNGRGETYLMSIAGFLFDSVKIDFDTGKRSVHYNAGTEGLNPDALSYSDSRNFFNDTNWQWVTASKRRRRAEYEVKYEITEQDYTNAK